jgi:hypothetical protein
MVIPSDKALDYLKSPTHLEVEISLRLHDKYECHSFTKCVVFNVQVV